jgi:hypothetical protein
MPNSLALNLKDSLFAGLFIPISFQANHGVYEQGYDGPGIAGMHDCDPQALFHRTLVHHSMCR